MPLLRRALGCFLLIVGVMWGCSQAKADTYLQGNQNPEICW
jgi:hypothetical protein